MSLLADYLRRVREEDAGEEEAESGRVTTRRLALSVAATVLGAALVRRIRRYRRSEPEPGSVD